MSAAKWHREQAAALTEEALNADDTARGDRPTLWAIAKVTAEIARENAAHHALAADVLEALAVVADALSDLSKSNRVEMLDTDGEATVRVLSDDQRAALATLAKAGAR